MSKNAFYFGVLAILTQTAEAYGINAAEIGRTVGLVGTEFGDLQRFAMKWAFRTVAVMAIGVLLLGVISIR